VRPLTDQVLVSSATIVEFTAQLTLTIVRGFDPTDLSSKVAEQLTALVTRRHRLGAKIPLSALIAASHVEGILSVSFASPVADIEVEKDEAPYCTAIQVDYEIVDDV
jgi:phage-related baseplate assembly protein